MMKNLIKLFVMVLLSAPAFSQQVKIPLAPVTPKIGEIGIDSARPTFGNRYRLFMRSGLLRAKPYSGNSILVTGSGGGGGGSSTLSGITDMSAYMRGVNAAASAAAVRTQLGLVIGTDVLAPTGSIASVTGTLPDARLSSNVTLNTGTQTLTNKTISGANNTFTAIPQSTVTNLITDLAGKQATLISGTNIKTINGNPVIGSGDLVISGGSGSATPSYLKTGTGINDYQDELWFWGDSNTWGAGVTEPKYSYANQLANYYVAKPINKGISGTGMSYGGATAMINRLSEIPTYTSNKRGALIMFGINDGINSIALNTYEADYGTVIDNFISKGWPLNKLAIVSSTPSGATMANPLTSYITRAQNVATAKGIAFIDVYTTLNGMGSGVTADAFHINNAGHTKTAELVATGLASTGMAGTPLAGNEVLWGNKTVNGDLAVFGQGEFLKDLSVGRTGYTPGIVLRIKGDQSSYIDFGSGSNFSSGSFDRFVAHNGGGASFKTGFGINGTSGNKAFNFYTASGESFGIRVNGGDASTTKSNSHFWVDQADQSVYTKKTVAHSLLTAVVTKTGSYTVSNVDHTISANAVSGVMTITLSDATSSTAVVGSLVSTREYVIVKKDASANVVTVAAAAGQTIMGAATYDLTTKGKLVKVQSDGTTDWLIVDQNNFGLGGTLSILSLLGGRLRRKYGYRLAGKSRQMSLLILSLFLLIPAIIKAQGVTNDNRLLRLDNSKAVIVTAEMWSNTIRANYDTLNCPLYKVVDGDSLIRQELYSSAEESPVSKDGWRAAVYLVPTYKYRYTKLDDLEIRITRKVYLGILQRLKELEARR